MPCGIYVRRKGSKKEPRETRLCDNLDCWNLIEVCSCRLRSFNHHFCDNKCRGIWLMENSPTKKRDVALKQAETLRNFLKQHPTLIENLRLRMTGESSPMKRPDVVMKVVAGRKKWCEEHPDAWKGENSWNWKGGVSYEPYCPKFNSEFKERVRAYFDYECIICGKSEEESGCRLCVHHVEYNKQACCDGEPVHFAALCRKCHAKTNHDRNRWENVLHIIIHEIYNDKSYFTKKEWSTLGQIL